jgi:surface antigen
MSGTMSGCITSDTGNKQLGGTLLGAGAGGLVGAQFGKGTGKLAATGAGTLIGALIGGAAGRSLDKADALYASQAGYQALEHQPAGTAVAWRNPDSGQPRQHSAAGDLADAFGILLPGIHAYRLRRQPAREGIRPGVPAACQRFSF